MSTKVISARLQIELYERIQEASKHLYERSLSNSSVETLFHIDALKLFCELAESGCLDDLNLNKINAGDIIYNFQNPKNKVLAEINASIQNIKKQLIDDSNLKLHSKNKDKNQDILSLTYSVENTAEEAKTLEMTKECFTLTEAWDFVRTEGYQFSKKSFKKQFLENEHIPDYTFRGLKRVKHPVNKGFTYQLV